MEIAVSRFNPILDGTTRLGHLTDTDDSFVVRCRYIVALHVCRRGVTSIRVMIRAAHP